MSRPSSSTTWTSRTLNHVASLVYLTDSFGAGDRNGRQITNTVWTVWAQAPLGQQHVTTQYLEQVVRSERECVGYVNSLNRMGSEDVGVVLWRRAPGARKIGVMVAVGVDRCGPFVYTIDGDGSVPTVKASYFWYIADW